MGAAIQRTLEDIKHELKRLLVEYLAIETMKPEDIADDKNLFGEGGVGLDSLDGVEIVVLLHRHYGLDVKSMQKSARCSVRSTRWRRTCWPTPPNETWFPKTSETPCGSPAWAHMGGASVAETRGTFWSGQRHPAAALPFASSLACPTFQVSSAPRAGGAAASQPEPAVGDAGGAGALAGAGLGPLGGDTRVGVCLGTTVACQLNAIAFYDAYRRKADPAMDPVLNFLCTNLAEAVGDLAGAGTADDGGQRVLFGDGCDRHRGGLD